MKKILILLIICFSKCLVGTAQNNPSPNKQLTLVKNVEFEGWPNCLKLSNGNIELIVTTDVGPRIIRFGFINEQNMFYISPADKGKTGGDEWRLYGGHRFWLAPEVKPLTYSPDNISVKYSWNGKTLKLTQNIDAETNISKEIEITMYSDKNEVKVLHRVINKSKNDIKVAPWAISACAAGGRAIVPQEPYIDPADYMLPIRPLVLWAYTKMDDPRYIWGEKFIQAKQDTSIVSETKIGVLNKQEWAAFYLNNVLFVKSFEYDKNVIYPDFCCNNEIYICKDFLEVETLGPLTNIAHQKAIEHTEIWRLAQVDSIFEDNEEQIDELIESVLGR